MATWEVAASGVSAYKVIMEATVSGSTVTVSAKWRRDAYGYSSNSGGATYRIVIDGTAYAGTWNFSSPAGGAIATQTINTRSRNVGYKGNVSISVTVDFDVSPGSGTITKTVNVSTTPDAPGTPSLSGALSASWSAAATNGSAIDNYQIQRADNNSFSGAASTTTGTSRSYTFTGASPGLRWYVRVRAHNANGWGPWSSTAYRDVPPVAPNTPTVTSYGTANVALSWSDSNAGGPTYDVQFADNASFSGATTRTAPGKSLNVTGLDSAVTYYFRVRAKTSTGTSGWSGTRTRATAPAAPARPTAPTVLGTSLGIAWTDANGSATSGYDVQWATNSSFTGATTVSLGRVSSYTIQNLNPGTTYYIRVRAKTSGDTGAWSPTLTQPTLPSVPPTFTIAASPAGRTATLTMTLSGVPSVTKWQIERRVQGQSTATTLETTVSPYTATGLTPGTTYEWRVSAFVGTYQSPWTAWVPLRQSRPNTSPGDYFDGATDDTEDITYQWTGAANNSTSQALGRRPTGWRIVGVPSAIGAVLYRVTGGYAGSFSARVDILADQEAAGSVTVQMDTGGAFWADVAEGGVYAFSTFVNPSKDQPFILQVAWYDEDGAFLLLSRDDSLASVLPADVWTRLMSVFTAPEGATRAFIMISDFDDGDVWTVWRGGDSFLLDAAMVTLSSTIEYFDGDTPDTSLFDYEWTGDPNASASVRNVLDPGDFDPLADPDCPAPPAAPRPPIVEDECIDLVQSWRRYWAIIPAQEVSRWLDVVPTIDIATADFAARQMRIRFYRNPDATPPADFSADVWESEQIVSYLPPRTVLTLDGITQRAWASVNGGASLAADRLLYGTGATPPTWPLLTCGDPYLISFDVPLDAPDGNVSIDVALTQRAG